ncbi:NF-kappa-B inhibitor-interacting Ras-like protein 1 [Camelus dromedarius]|uniref:NF-kappa-B inhibitor-interacting Ras-like protein 1 n=1 Tax=Camelus dromedarius TaxID=9838 RepID=A0A5N4EIG2_CAMDR|nr:NF-kappa-B inhibitor-interacting Ras-like protein 1 [Camelus dromedarius]KAB1283145.1 NF-kappa-B inhibitor-interacting Ras-like protein 1 [Camelus dromedarius]
MVIEYLLCTQKERTLKTDQVEVIKGQKQGGGTGDKCGEELVSLKYSKDIRTKVHSSVNNLESFQRVELLKKEIDKFKDKKEVAIVVLGNKIDLSEQRQVDAEVAQQWAKSEKVRLWEVTVTDRRTLIEPFTLLASKLSQPQSKSSFPLPGRKNKGNSSSEN